MGLVNGAFIIWRPPHEFVTVSVPVAGGAGTDTDPPNVKNPPTHAPGTAVTILQFVTPAPALPLFVWLKFITPG